MAKDTEGEPVYILTDTLLICTRGLQEFSLRGVCRASGVLVAVVWLLRTRLCEQKWLDAREAHAWLEFCPWCSEILCHLCIRSPVFSFRTGSLKSYAVTYSQPARRYPTCGRFWLREHLCFIQRLSSIQKGHPQQFLTPAICHDSAPSQVKVPKDPSVFRESSNVNISCSGILWP